MFGLARWSPFDDILNFHREVDRLFNQVWNDLPERTARTNQGGLGFQVSTKDDAWRIQVPMPGIDPQHVRLEVAGNTLSIRTEEPQEDRDSYTHFERTITVPQFLDLDRISASHRHGMLELTLPLRESVKPRRIRIESAADDKQLNAAA